MCRGPAQGLLIGQGSCTRAPNWAGVLHKGRDESKVSAQRSGPGQGFCTRAPALIRMGSVPEILGRRGSCARNGHMQGATTNTHQAKVCSGSAWSKFGCSIAAARLQPHVPRHISAGRVSEAQSPRDPLLRALGTRCREQWARRAPRRRSAVAPRRGSASRALSSRTAPSISCSGGSFGQCFVQRLM